MQLSSWHDETSARNTVEENLHVLPILQSLLFPWPLDENQETEIGDQENEEDDVSIDAYLTDELRTLLFPEISPERAPNLPISLAELSTACERAMQQLQCCPSCETWYFQMLVRRMNVQHAGGQKNHRLEHDFVCRFSQRSHYSLQMKTQGVMPLIFHPIHGFFSRKSETRHSSIPSASNSRRQTYATRFYRTAIGWNHLACE